MIRLNMPKEPYWLDLVLGVRLMVRPATTALRAAARAKGYRLARAAAAGHADIGAAGGAVTGIADLSDPDNMLGLAEQIYAQALARAAIVDWRGVLAAEGEDIAPVNETTVGDLMSIGDIADDFLAKYLRPLHEMDAEGNASGSSPNGTSAAEPGTAKGAGTARRPAPMAGPSKGKRARAAAPTSSTSR